MISIRSASAEDAEAAGQICHDAFAAIAEEHNFAKDFTSPEAAAGLLAVLIAHPGVFSRIAEDDGRIVGSNFMDERGPIFGIGPITIDPSAQNSGSGRRLMEDALQRVAEQGAPGVRLLQDAYHARSFALYASLGFEVQDATAVMQGAPPDWVDPAAAVRAAGDGDLDECAALCVRVHGHPRRVEVQDAIGQGAMTTTPLQLAFSIGGIASGGYFARPHLISWKDMEALGLEIPSPTEFRVPLREQTVALITDGLYGVVNEGGTGGRARIQGLDVGGKTGTAQVASLQASEEDDTLKDNAWFVGLAPRRNPEIVVVALYEGGEHGYLAAPVVREVIKAYFDKKEDSEFQYVQESGAGEDVAVGRFVSEPGG